MEKSSCRLYSGPLSVAAQKILDALQAQRRHVGRHPRTHQLENGQYGSQWEPMSQSSVSQANRKDQFWSVPHVSSSSSQWQDSQILDFSKSSQASSCSSYWDNSPQTPACYQRSHMYSHRRDLELAAFHSSQSLSFSQCETALCVSQRDRNTLALQTPQRNSEHQVTAWQDSEEKVPQFTINLSPDDPGDIFSLTAGQTKHKTQDHNFPAFDIETNSSSATLTDSWPDMTTVENVPQRHLQDNASYSQWKHTKESSYQDVLTAQPLKRIRLHLAQGKQVEYGLNLTNQMSGKEFDVSHDITETEKGKQEICTTGNNSKPVEMQEVLPHNTDDLVPDKVGNCQLALGEDKIENGVYKENSKPSEHCAVIKTSDICSTKCPLMQSDSSKLVQFDPVAEKATTGEGSVLMEVELEMAEEESKAETKMLEGKEKQLEFCLGAKHGDNQQDTKNNSYKDVSSEDKKLEMAAVEKKSVQIEDSRKSCLTPVKSQEFSESVSTNSTHAQHDKEQNEHCNTLPLPPPLKPSFTLKRKYENPQPQSVTSDSSKGGSARRPPKWEPPRSSQEQKGEERKMLKTLQERSEKCTELFKKGPSSADFTLPKKPRCGPDNSKRVPESLQPGPIHNHTEHRNQSKPGSLGLTSDPRVTDASKMSQDEMELFLKKAGQSEALVLTVVFRDGTTQLDPEQKLIPPVCGLLLLMKNNLDQSTAKETLGPNDSLVYLKLDHAPAWAQQPTHHLQELFTRDLLLHVFSSCRLVVCYKAKDLLRVVLQRFKRELTWKQVMDCQIQDPQVSGWLLDPADPASCFQDLLNKHCKKPYTTPALGTKKVSQIIAGLYSLYKLNGVISSKLQSQGLWELYSDMELRMIPVLAAMESCYIHVDKEALRRTSDLLGTKMKQLEQEAHKAAGQMFLLTSSTQLRTVLFEKLHLHKRCENKKLPKTINKQQSTSEAALLQLQDLHPLPKIILEYRQVHKIKSTFVDGILSCMMTKNYISSTWYQTSVVTGRISAKHPNFQALPRQPLQVTRKQYIPGKEEEVVIVHPRAMFIPKDGWTFLSADFCQVELRLLAHLCSDPELLRVFTNPKADVFSMLASQWKGVSETEVTSEDREHAKRIVYSVVYGAGPERLSGILGVSSEQARRFQESFLQTYKEVQTFIQRTVSKCQEKGYVLSIMGRRRTLANINSPDWGVRMQAERQAVNFVVQGSAADLCKMAMIRIFSLLSTSNTVSARLIAQLHDELLYEVEDSQVEQFAAVVKSTMESLQHIDQLNVHLKVPLKVAVSSGKSWGSMSELNIIPLQPSHTPH